MGRECSGRALSAVWEVHSAGAIQCEHVSRPRRYGRGKESAVTMDADTPGANPSAEEVEEAMADGASQVNNVVHSFRLQSTSFDKKVSLISFVPSQAAGSAGRAVHGLWAEQLSAFHSVFRRTADRVNDLQELR